MEEALKAYAVAADYGVADVTTAATYRIATVYRDFGKALMASERPKKLSKVELEQYNVLLEEQAFPFEEKATELHEVNAHRAASGVYDKWVKSSFDALRELRPVRYGKVEVQRRSRRCDPLASPVALGALAAPARRRRLLDRQRRLRRRCAMRSRRAAARARRRRRPARPPRRRAARAAPPVYDAPVNPATQRAFDDASRALRSGRVDEAERAYKALAQANPELRRTARQPRRASIARRASSTKSVAELEQAAKLSPRQPVYLNQLGIAYRQQGQFAKARDAYQRAIALDPGYAGGGCSTWASCTTCIWATRARALELYGRYLAAHAERRRDRNQMGRRPQEPQARTDHGQSAGEAMNAQAASS